MKRNIHIVAVAAVVGALAAGAVQTLFSAFADQSERVPPTSGIYTGVQFSGLIGDSIRSISSGNKGSSAPANVGGSAVDGLEWLDSSSTPWIDKRYVNGGWAVKAAYDPTTSSYIGVIGGGVGSIASATTTDLGSVAQANVTISGTTTITGFGSSAPTGVVKIIRFSGILTLTYSANLTVPTGGYDLVTAANDRAIVTHLGSGAWEVTQYTRASGVPVDYAAVGRPGHEFSAATSPLHVPGDGRALTRTSYPAFTAKVTRAQNGTRTSGNATITGIADTTKFGVGMWVEGTGLSATGCTIASFVANTSITLNSSACVTSSGTSTVTVFLTGYGSGGSAGSTVGVPNCQGRVIAGLDPTRALLTTAATGFNADAAAMAVGSGAESRNLTIANINAFTPSGSFSGSLSSLNAAIPARAYDPNGSTDNTHLSAGSNLGSDLGTFNLSTVTGNVSGTITMNSLGSGTAHGIVQPTLIADCVVRVTP